MYLVLAFIRPAARYGVAVTAVAVGLLVIVQLADLRAFTLSATVRRAVWLAGSAGWVALIALVILRFIVIG
jgi:hypothetical protein